MSSITIVIICMLITLVALNKGCLNGGGGKGGRKGGGGGGGNGSKRTTVDIITSNANTGSPSSDTPFKTASPTPSPTPSHTPRLSPTSTPKNNEKSTSKFTGRTSPKDFTTTKVTRTSTTHNYRSTPKYTGTQTISSYHTYRTTLFNSFYEDCGMKLIDVRDNICCRGAFRERVDNALCCYSNGVNVTSYNSISQICCNGEVHVRRDNYACCGRNVYNVISAVCCRNKVYKMNNPNFSGFAGCCNNAIQAKPYDLKFQVCCNGFINEKVANMECCGNHAMNSRTSICCQGIRSRTVNARCCGYMVYNYAKQRCRVDLFGYHVITRRT